MQAQLAEEEKRDREFNEVMRRANESIQRYKALYPDSSVGSNIAKSSNGSSRSSGSRYYYVNDPYGAENYKTPDDFADDWEDDFDDWDEAYDYWEDTW